MTIEATDRRIVLYSVKTRYGFCEHTDKIRAIDAARREARDGWPTYVRSMETDKIVLAAAAEMTAEQFRTALDRLALTQQGAAEVLGLGLRSVARLRQRAADPGASGATAAAADPARD